MNWILALALICTFALPTAHAKGHRKSKGPPKAFPSKVHLKKIDSCVSPDASKSVMVLKQWHLAPKTVTKGFKEKYAQEQNQTAIYNVLSEGATRGELQLIVTEGCEGEINDDFKPTFNGWSYDDLITQSKQKKFDKIITLAPLKVKAKYGDKIKVVCGDSDKWIQEGNLRLSNLRGWAGYYAKLTANKGDEASLKLYSESAAEQLKMPRETQVAALVPKIKEQIKLELIAFNKSLSERNESFVKSLTDGEYTRAAIVVGGLHAKDLKERLQKAGFGCTVYEPPGYQTTDEKLIEAFEQDFTNESKANE